MIQDVLGDPPRPSHQDVLEEEQVGTDHVVDVFPKSRRIMEITQVGINRGFFLMAQR